MTRKSKHTKWKLEFFVSVSLFNGISTFVGHSMPKPSFKNKSRYYLTHSKEDKGVHTFPKDICPKVNATEVRTRLLRFRTPAL